MDVRVGLHVWGCELMFMCVYIVLGGGVFMMYVFMC